MFAKCDSSMYVRMPHALSAAIREFAELTCRDFSYCIKYLILVGLSHVAPPSVKERLSKSGCVLPCVDSLLAA